MKKISLLFVILSIFISCSDSGRLSDAYGNFEAVETIISAEASGKLLKFTVEEGKSYNAKDTVGLIDTIQLSLKKAQLIAAKTGIKSKISNILAQIDVYQQTKNTYLIEKNVLTNYLPTEHPPAAKLTTLTAK